MRREAKYMRFYGILTNFLCMFFFFPSTFSFIFFQLNFSSPAANHQSIPQIQNDIKYISHCQ